MNFYLNECFIVICVKVEVAIKQLKNEYMDEMSTQFLNLASRYNLSLTGSFTLLKQMQWW